MTSTAAKLVLEKAKELLVTKGWTQGQYAKDANGNKTDLYDSSACSFCSTGALMVAIPFGAWGLYDSAITCLSKAADIGSSAASIERWNDAVERTREDVLLAFDKAIAIAENA